jgi:hypothetical protein
MMPVEQVQKMRNRFQQIADTQNSAAQAPKPPEAAGSEGKP